MHIGSHSLSLTVGLQKYENRDGGGEWNQSGDDGDLNYSFPLFNRRQISIIALAGKLGHESW